MFYKVVKAIIGVLVKVLYRPKFENLELIPKNGPIIFAGNHIHAFDPLVVAMSTKRQIRFFSKIELVKGPFGFFFKLLNVIPVDRSKKNPNALTDAVKSLKDNEAICIFPEGTRNRTDKLLQDFKFGAVSLAKKNNALVIPVGVSGDYKFRPKNLVARIGEPIDVSEMDLEEANEKLHKAVETLILENLKEGNGSEQDFERAKHSGLI